MVNGIGRLGSILGMMALAGAGGDMLRPRSAREIIDLEDEPIRDHDLLAGGEPSPPPPVPRAAPRHEPSARDRITLSAAEAKRQRKQAARLAHNPARS